IYHERHRLRNGRLLNYAAGGGGGDAVLLLHGWPQTNHAWRRLMPLLASDYRVVAPDLPGFGNSSKPHSGYDKKTIALSLHELMQSLGHERYHVVGHDLGGQAGYPVAAQNPAAVKSLTLIEAGIPGLGDKDNAANPWLGGSWHFGFNMLADLPEILLAGKEREFLNYIFFRDTIGLVVTDAISNADLDIYATALSQPGGVRGSFSHYQAMMQDREDNRAFAKHALTMPVLMMGAQCGAGLSWLDTVQAAALHVETALVSGSGHYLPEERPSEVADILSSFIARAI
ncbi:MAG: alpha/beta hydrolase, partial [Xanthobacteraceae bacterium]